MARSTYVYVARFGGMVITVGTVKHEVRRLVEREHGHLIDNDHFKVERWRDGDDLAGYVDHKKEGWADASRATTEAGQEAVES